MKIELLELFRDRRFWMGPALAVAALLLLTNLAVVHWREDLHLPPGPRMLEQGMSLPTMPTPQRPVRFDWSIGDHLATYEHYIPDARKNKLVIISGMSQMYTINEYKPGDLTIAELMDDALAPHGVRVFGLAAPNLSHEEALFLLLSTLRKPETTPNTFIFAVSFEKLREVDLRPRYQAYLVEHPDVIAEWRQVARSYAKQYPMATKKMLATLDQIQQQQAAPGKENFETRLRRRVSDVIPLIGERRNLNSHAQSAIFSFRNLVFGINNMTKRPIVRERYDTNREFLGLLADVAHQHGVNVILYICPFNPRAENPYIPEEYAAFKKWMTAFTNEKGIPMANLENAVPAQDWGLFFGGPDFKHFKGDGHRRTAAALLSAFHDQLFPQPAAKTAEVTR